MNILCPPVPKRRLLLLFAESVVSKPFSKQVLEYLEDEISSSPTRITRENVRHSLFIEFSRFACENKLTLSVFVNKSYKYSIQIEKHKGLYMELLQLMPSCISPANIILIPKFSATRPSMCFSD